MDYDINIRWRAFPLRPDIPFEGILLEQVFAGSQIDIKIIKDKFKKMADDLDLPSCELKKIYNSTLAQELGFWAKSFNKEDEYHDAAFRAFYAQGKNISDKQILVKIAETIGLQGEKAAWHLDMRTFKPQVEKDWKLARDLELVAAPTYIINKSKLVGAHPYEKLQKFVESNGAKRRDL